MRRPHDVVIGAAAFLVASAQGCDDDFVRGWLVDRTRVLGARVEAENDPLRASLRPGERANVTWTVAGTNGRPRLSASFALCARPRGNTPEPRCEGDLFASGPSAGDDGERVTIPFALPPAGAIGDAEDLLLLTAFCEGAPPPLDTRTFQATCASGAPALLATATIELDARLPNRNPTVGPDDISFDGAVLPVATSAPAGASACSSDAAMPLVVANGSPHAFGFRLRAEEREARTGSDPMETLLVTHVVTAGTLERQYSSLEPSEPATKEVTVPWTPPPAAEVPDAGRVVEAFFVLRDGRGGVSATRRTLCVRRGP